MDNNSNTSNDSNTMSNNIHNNNNNNNRNSMAEPVTSKINPRHTGEPSTLLYEAAARNLREYHSVPSITAGSLGKTMSLLRLRLARLVAQGLAPEKLLKGETTAEAGVILHISDGNIDSSSGSEINEEHAVGHAPDDSSSNSDSSSPEGMETEDSKRPIHAALVANGIELCPRETRPLLRALGVRPHRLVQLGLVQHEALLRSRSGGRSGGGRGGRPPHQQRGHPRGGGRHGRGMGRPRGLPRHAPPPDGHGHSHGHGHRPPHHGRSRCPSSSFHGPSPGRSAGPLHRTECHGPEHHPHGEHEQDSMHPFRGISHGRHPPVRGGLHPHHGLRHHGGESEGDEEMAMRTGRRDPPRGRGRGHHAHRPPPGIGMHPDHGPGHHHSDDSKMDEEMLMHGAPPGPFRSNGRHAHHPPPGLPGGVGHGGPPHRGAPGIGELPHHGRRPSSSGGMRRHRRPGHFHGEKVQSSGSEGEGGEGRHLGPRHRGHPRMHGGGDGHHHQPPPPPVGAY